MVIQVWQERGEGCGKRGEGGVAREEGRSRVRGEEGVQCRGGRREMEERTTN